MEDESQDVEIENSKSMGYKEIVLNQYNKVVSSCNCELRGGFYTRIPTKDGEFKEIYVQDTREVFNNGCFALALILRSKFDKKMKEEFKIFQEKIKNIRNEFIERSSPNEEVILGEAFYDKTRDKIFLETYKEKKLKIHLKLFAELSDLLARKNYLQIGASTY